MYRRYGAYSVYKRRRQRGALAIKLMIATLGAIGAAGYFSSQKDEAPSFEQPIVAVIQAQEKNSETSTLEVRESIELKNVEKTTYDAKATRLLGASKSAILVLGDLAPPPKDFYYEVWAIQPDPYKFISLGPMVLRTDNKFGLVYETVENIRGFTQVIVTLEKSDKDPAPSAHVMSGDF